MTLAKKYVVVAPFVGEPKKSDFRIEEETLPTIKNGEFLAEAAYLSVDPYQRMKIGNTYPCDMIGGQIAKVIESKNPEYPVGTWVMGHFGWRTFTIVKPGDSQLCKQKPFMYVLPDFGSLPMSLGLGVCGRVGNTAYFGFTQICQPKPGETVVVSGAAGAVGSHVGQIAKIMGCKVIGLAGTEEKCDWLVKELGFDHAGNYKTINIADFIKKNAPEGVDCYFDNVGGEISSAILSQMNPYGRVTVCGAISSYNETNPEKRKGVNRMGAVTDIIYEPTQNFVLIHSYHHPTVDSLQTIEAGRVSSMEGIRQNLQWVKEGKLKYREHTFVGFENAVDAFLALFCGANTGKTIVKLDLKSQI